MHFLYVLYSSCLDRYYVGESSDPAERLNLHNTGFFKGSYTARASDWEIKVLIPFKNIHNARKAEIFVKKMNSRKFIEKLCKEHQWLLERFDL